MENRVKPMQSVTAWRGAKTPVIIVIACIFICNAGVVAGQTALSPCDQAAIGAAQNRDVPVEILLAITRVETGRAEGNQVYPWPWSVNLDGKGYWFENADQAIDFADQQLALGIENFDVGCFQINLRWHGAEFSSLADVFDPQTNANYAAKFLSDLYAEKGDWGQAVAAYHSRTPEFATEYAQKVQAVMADLPSLSDAIPATAVVASARSNRFPFLQGGKSAGVGSIVPIIDGATPLIGGFQ